MQVMLRQQHKVRGENVECVAWFESQSINCREYPPPTIAFDGLQFGDVYIHRVLKEGCNSPNDIMSPCQIWIYSATSEDGIPNGRWDVVVWGYKRAERRFVLTPKGSPSFVRENTWTKKYRNKLNGILE